jgi:predicted dehydrogenase
VDIRTTLDDASNCGVPMKFLVIGLGSMGRRRIRCLQRLGFKDLIGFDPKESRRIEAREKHGIVTADDWALVRSTPVDAWIISTPPDTHVAYGLEATERNTAFFAEAGVPDLQTGELIARLKKSGVTGAPSCTMRYYPGPRRIKQLVAGAAVGRPLAFTYQVGQYLPDWHPWESYKEFYVSKRATGACREIVPFELAWLIDIFGPVGRLSCLKGRVSDLDADIDDVYQILLRFERNLIGHLMVDVVARPAVRVFRLVGTVGTLEWDHASGRLRVYDAQSKSWSEENFDFGTVEPGYIHADEPYVAELADFIAAVRGEKPWPFSFDEDERILDLLVRAETSDHSGRHC